MIVNRLTFLDAFVDELPAEAAAEGDVLLPAILPAHEITSVLHETLFTLNKIAKT